MSEHLPTFETLSAAYPSHKPVLLTLQTLLTATSPPFIYITDPYTPRITSNVLKQFLAGLVPSPSKSKRTVYAHACLNAISAFTPRLFFDTALNALAGHVPLWQEGCANWRGNEGVRYNESVDGFIWGIRDVCEYLRQGQEQTGKRESKGKEKERDVDVRMVLVVERAERLLPELVVPLTRLAELTQTPITTILTSSLPWQDTKPPLGASPDPFFMQVGPPSKESTLHILSSVFSDLPRPDSDPTISRVSQDSIRTLHTPYLSTLHSVCAPFVPDPDELAYIGAALWPAFLHELGRLLRAHEQAGDEIEITEETKMRLLRAFAPKFREALEALFPRLACAADFLPSSRAGEPRDKDTAMSLTRTEKYVLIAAYLASTNPPKSDMRMVYRGSEGDRKRRRRRRSSVLASPSKKDGGAVKIPQRLLGPTTFPLDRMLAIMGNLMIEHEEELDFGGDEWEMEGLGRERNAEVEVGRVGVLGAITNLTQSHLLIRTSPPERIDGPPTFKCGVGYEVVLGLAREVGVSLGERIWEAA
ncbi:hypothetical protein GLOTRDRAFT_140895 [Gloeophyllum trabeum ATCC 11539]|uniref:Origin recognition complex subunit 5 C-terminal domain-containing protein n=1 Tax=Gloeophyllum trabeum (strain ATCC 11539 / FP-39264 / Madison 617) TaxID=670483 RepID=S7PV79_GLOTA|nr:uncharacterized protein GLOTRDRAFT_140895 [Gloeophyllum trabeum ATCC 11539]EPQ51438.1 hypothetical protein GLOTRDRAFT_140895 [Gloeophyllum trabeum ATCC 11539]